MKHLSGIIIPFIIPVLLAFGAGGLCLTKCACSGRTTLLMLDDMGCCPGESGCMTVTMVSMSDSDMPDQSCNAPVLECVDVPVHSFLHPFIPLFQHPSIPATVYSPPRFTLTTVLRV